MEIINGEIAFTAHGDIVQIRNSEQSVVANYHYDAWGKLLSITDANGNAITSQSHAATLNPLRYRGYVYDNETGLYLTGTRYYDPEIGRFINADGYVSTGQGLAGYNMFAYCNNNPVMCCDCLGLCPHDLLRYESGIFEGQYIYNPDCWQCYSHGEWCLPQEHEDFLDALGERESSNNYQAVNQFGYLGRYQMGQVALQDAGYKDSNGNWTATANMHGVYSNDDFLNNPFAQKCAIITYHQKMASYINRMELDTYIGSQYCGINVTSSGLLASCHLVGIGSMKSALRKNMPTRDGNGVLAREYMSMFGGFNLAIKWD